MTKLLSIQECDNSLAALDAADQLSNAIQSDLKKLENIDPKEIIGKATKMLMTRQFSLEALGLSPDIINHIKSLEKITTTARSKYRERVESDKAELVEAQEVNHG